MFSRQHVSAVPQSQHDPINSTHNNTHQKKDTALTVSPKTPSKKENACSDVTQNANIQQEKTSANHYHVNIHEKETPHIHQPEQPEDFSSLATASAAYYQTCT